MQAETKKNILKWLGYSMFFMAAFTYFIYKTFPYKQALARFTTPQLRRLNVRVKMSELRPYWLSGVEAKDLVIRWPAKKGVAAVKVKQVKAHASLFRLLFRKVSATFDINVARGTIRGSAVQSGNTIQLKTNIKKINLNSLGEKRKRKRRRRRRRKGQKKVKPKNTSLLATLFAPVYGKLKAKIRLKIPLPGASRESKPKKGKKKRRRRRRRRRVRGLDLTKLSGRIKINIRRLSIGPGELPTAQMGELPVPLVRLGTFVLQTKISKGKVEIVRCISQGTDIELELKGSIRLRRNLRYTVFRGELKFKINKSFINNLDPTSMLKTGLGILGPPPRGGFYRYRIRIPLGGGRPSFRKF